LAWLMVPTLRPADVIELWAVDCVMPTTFGTVFIAAGPRETVKLTAVPIATDVPDAGFWLIILPADTVVLLAWLMVPTLRPADVIELWAVDCVMPTTFGTVFISGPAEMTRLTEVPGDTDAPPAGYWLLMFPAGTVGLYEEPAKTVTRPTAVNVLFALFWVMPTTLGTVV